MGLRGVKTTIFLSLLCLGALGVGGCTDACTRKEETTTIETTTTEAPAVVEETTTTMTTETTTMEETPSLERIPPTPPERPPG